MSDIDPELPDYLVDAILSEGPPPEAVDLVKNAFTWRTIDAELMELTYDSVLDTAGVRDASSRRTMEFTLHDITIVIEVDATSIHGQLVGDDSFSVELIGPTAASTQATNSFSFRDLLPGSYRLQFRVANADLMTAAFTVG